MACGPLGSSVRALTQAAELGEGGDGLALREDGDEHGDRGEQAHDRERDRARRRVHDSPKMCPTFAAGKSAVLARLEGEEKLEHATLLYCMQSAFPISR